MQIATIKKILDKALAENNGIHFIADDPISLPHLFSKKEDIEIIAFWIAMLAWGNRKAIINSGKKLVDLMDNAPYQFITQHQDKDLMRFKDFKHRTFNYTDTLYFIEFLRQHYQQFSSLESAFTNGMTSKDLHTENALIHFHNYFFSLPDFPDRTKKHIATPARKATCKRINMFLRWMVRNDKNGVDFGVWKKIKPAQLLCPLDVHVERNARQLGLIQRAQTDWQTVLELTESLRLLDPKDPIKYDIALFGMGANKREKIA